MNLSEVHLPAQLEWIVWITLAVVGLLGVVAVVSPRRFRAIARGGGKWVDTSELLAKMDKRVDIDKAVGRYSRLFGLIVVAAALFLAYTFYTRVLGNPPPF